MRILGIDPGIETTGYGVVDDNHGLKMIDYGCIITSRELSLAQRLVVIHQKLAVIIAEYHPDTVAVEEIFFSKNVKTATSVGHARGVILLTIAEAGLSVFEYTPLQVKHTVCGAGHADKAQIQKAVKLFLQLDHIPKPDDAADALAIAICHIQRNKICRLMGK
ncbi:crossover junction endodeoxyribonuclease RuvC [bacterium]|nr:crossover junction endodeoxyribonuclease RuvC [bacterium]MBU1752620.1 crossover junction endodeoxyribonuclease RuvC [bacterium]